MPARQYRPLPIPRRPPDTPWPADLDPIAVSIREAAELVGVKRDAIRARIKTGKLRAYQLGRRMVVRIADLAAYRRPGYESRGADMSAA